MFPRSRRFAPVLAIAVAAALLGAAPSPTPTPTAGYTVPSGAPALLTRSDYAVASVILPGALTAGQVHWPVPVGTRITDTFGPRSCAGCSAFHHGTDFTPGYGSPIEAIADGTVRVAEDGDGSLGVNVIIDHRIDGALVSSLYAHMIHGSLQVAEGDSVTTGQIIGLVGSTGQSTGPHLHFGILLNGTDYVDSLQWLYQHAN